MKGNTLKRQILKTAMLAILCGILAAGPRACSVDQVIGLLQDAALIASAAGPILSPVSPEYGPLVSQVGKDLNDLAGLYSKFEKAQAADKPGLAGNIHALTATALQSLQTIFYDARIKDPKTKATITAFVTAANTAIVALESKLGSASSVQANSKARADVLTRSSVLPVNTKAKSGSDLKAAWNLAVKGDYPSATVK